MGLHLKQDIANDTVAIRWLRTAGMTITGVAALWAAFWFVLSPRATEWAADIADRAVAQVATDTERTAANVDRLEDVVNRLEENVQDLNETILQDRSPSWRFDPVDTQISDGQIGGWVNIRVSGYKLRECGAPRVDLYFINGQNVYHRFVNTTLLDANNRGVAVPVSPDRRQEIVYRARIPERDGVSPGRARGFVSITYPDVCPAVEEVLAGPLHFRILD